MDSIKKLNLEFRESDRYSGKWLWPADDYWGWKNLNKKPNVQLPSIISSQVKKKNLIIQAGGNCGLYPKYYSSVFKKVVTFEPDHRNFFCLTYNVPESNVFKFQACVGNENTSLSLSENPVYAGMASLTVSGEGDIPQITIDSLNLNPDLIHLDIEGFEGFALLGAKETILRSKPIIALETNGLGDAHGWNINTINDLMSSLGYSIAVDLEHDKIYKPL
jgi:FkbM family methyltransferase